jgi:hypothetical protein
LPNLGSHRFAHFVREHEARLVLNAQVARHRQHALALDFITENRDGEQVGSERHLMMGKKSSGGNAEILLAGFATPARSLSRAAAGIDDCAAAVWAKGVAAAVRPAEPDKTRSTSSSLIRITDANVSVLARLERRKC